MFEKIISKTPDDSQSGSPAPAKSQAPASAPAAASPAAPSNSPSKPAAAVSSSAGGGQRNILSNDVHINGSVRFTNDLLVDGRIEGEISSDGALTVAENAHIKAEVKTKSVVIYGKVHGNIVCTDRVEIKASAEMVGDVKAGTLSIEPGAIFVGKSEVGTPSAAPKQSGSAPQGGNNPKKPQQGNQSGKDVARRAS